ncbi:adenosylcobinamide-GDP ribazoletransferase [Clostridium autoethanogenum]|uniref:Adenosylcobinamide-GDP ribazoletransferase n=2 Tax=Clostridium autoethanogenum TaxID=84023 RepID=A0A3M0SCA3_9CLOT|nr:adenosylcobinamide-GDP ribazoletransferase [Clostridium autoethanogenum]AGY75686.2 adenosylcobinamide-GDP ribazoletransferase [Clostridium autoethanogenum DSM 10061]ALU35850.1 Cobalamin synthase [Clostridium autoethanogenum DSM 10061]OVY52091.1 Cobalamin synthase [Clostridium autoethanogenum]RMC96153.1 adenosylcobinamide-GDP ribazoletransferase [Clostridium autoethanogenum]
MKNLINDFFLMVQFMTRIPINKSFSCEQENFRRGTVFMPVIGLLVGGIQWIVYKLCIMVLPVNVSVAIILLLGIIITGALHLDGLGDMSDGFFAFKGNDKIIEIMKDSRIGTYACATIVMDIILKYSLLCSIVPRFSFIIIAAPVIGRFSIVFIAFIGRTAKKTGTGNFFIGNIGKLQMFLALVVTIAILLCGMNPKYAAIMIPAALIMALLINVFCNKKIGGLTGDLFGADNEMVEILTMIIAAVILTKLV